MVPLLAKDMGDPVGALFKNKQCMGAAGAKLQSCLPLLGYDGLWVPSCPGDWDQYSPFGIPEHFHWSRSQQ